MLYKSLRRHHGVVHGHSTTTQGAFDLNLVGRIIVVSIYVKPPPLASACGCSFSVPPRQLCTSLFCERTVKHGRAFFSSWCVVVCCLLVRSPSLFLKGANNKWYYYSFALFHHSPPFCSVWGTNDAVSKYYQWWTSLFWAHHGWTRVVGDGRQWIDPSLRSFSPGENTTADYRGLDLPSIYCNDGQAKQFIIQ